MSRLDTAYYELGRLDLLAENDFIILHEGRIQADGPTSEIFHNEKLLADCYLEKPLRMQDCPVCG
ncbi:MAG: hypothetical protein QNK14_07055 [Desulfobacterales bacterium]|nr:hypothetical protein [Desulfobacterales bacterium]